MLGCSLLWATAGWHRGNLLAWAPGSSLLLLSPSRGYCLRLCTGFQISPRVSWKHWSGQLHFAPRSWLRSRCKARLLHCRSKEVGMAVGRLAASSPTDCKRQGYAGLTPASVCQTFSAVCSCCAVATLTHDWEQEKCQGCILILQSLIIVSGNKSFLHLLSRVWKSFWFSFWLANIKGRKMGSSMQVGSWLLSPLL